ncbi:common plant regulatory factor 1 isoform X3 [Magnolia sinica]|uniref:common plant regulatory factor 1 isoform X3 n=1 Tax=Magnolia sinica TaxID=86752 RepID=UPI002659B762|nr:common plant regulatory factor 1 isoform X3 [Magnolia sinica]
MGNTEAGTPPKSEKASSPMQTNVHAYPDWAAIQAYYGPGVGLPPPYFSPAVTAGHPPHPYMWGPQHMIPPYGTPYAAIYPHGGVYAHPSVPIGPHSHGHGATSTSENAVATPLSIETPSKSSGNKDRGLMKKLKGFDGLAVSIGNGHSEKETSGAARGHSQSSENYGTEGSSDGSDGNTTKQGNEAHKKSSSEETPVTGQSAAGREGSNDTHANNTHGGEANGSSTRSLGVTVAVNGVAGKPAGTAPPPSMTPGMEFRGPTSGKAKLSSATVPPAAGMVVPVHDGVPSEVWMQDERELKRERRKQSNRESARRSRLRKQAETEELATRVESLNAENMSLRLEMNRLTEKSEKLRQENSSLMEKLKKAQLGQAGEGDANKMEAQGAPPVAIENLLSRVNNSSSISRSGQREGENRESSNSKGKLHQLLEPNTRKDAVVAG